MNRRRVAFLLLTLAALLALAVILRDRWLPSLLAALTGNAQLIDTLESVVSILGALATAALAGAGLLGLRRRSPPPPAHLVQPVALDTLRDRFRDLRGQTFAYIDRGALGSHTLNPRRLAIIGPPNVGKSREAVELIGRCLEPRRIAATRIFQQTTELRGTDIGAVAGQIRKDVGEPGALLLFIDDLPYYFRIDELERLSAALKELERSGPLHVVVTARDDRMLPGHADWLRAQGFETVPLGRWESNDINRLAEDGTYLVELPADDAGRAALVAGNDGTAELTRQTLLELAHLGRSDREAVEATQRSTYLEMWRATRRELIDRQPAVEPLLWAMAVFYTARVTPYTNLVLALAARRMTGLWRERRLRRALPVLQDYVSEVDRRFTVREYVAEAEGIAEAHARREVATFLLGYRRWTRAPGLLRLHGARIQHADALLDIALASDGRTEADSIAGFYTAAIHLRTYPRNSID